MNKLVGYKELPEEILKQIDCVVEIWKKHMGDELVGVYLHGSIALNAFNPNSGDIDLLIVVKDSVSVQRKIDIAKDIIEIDGCPRPLEMSAIKLKDAIAWKNPGNCVFHYSDFWTEKYLQRFENDDVEVYVADNEFPDADVTSYIRLLHQCGIVLFGQDISKTFSGISDEDFWAAISADIDDYEFAAYNPRYYASNILILGRILSFKVGKRILSKYEAGIWMIEKVPKYLKHIPESAMKIWFEGEEHSFLQNELEELRSYLIGKIKQ